MKALRTAILAPLHLYRRVISPLLPARCRYYPSCSSYAVEAVREYGIVRGGILAAWRVMRCNPLSEGGFDHVRDQRLFRRSRREVAT
jgi:putative membrane protein insertion efficiency factor